MKQHHLHQIVGQTQWIRSSKLFQSQGGPLLVLQNLKMKMIHRMLKEMVSLILNISIILRKLLGILEYIHVHVFAEIELPVIEPRGEDTTIDAKEVSKNDCLSDKNQQNEDQHSTETVSDTDNQIITSSIENHNEISSTEDDSPLVEDIISQSMNSNKVFLDLKTDFESKINIDIHFFQKHFCNN